MSGYNGELNEVKRAHLSRFKLEGLLNSYLPPREDLAAMTLGA